jgi:hypothetical protein
MDPANHFSTPIDTLGERRSSRVGSLILMGLVALQAAGLALCVPIFLELGRIGAVSVGHLLLTVLATGLLLLGALLLLLSSSRSPRYVFASSALLGFLVLLKWPVLIVLTGTVLAAAGLVLGIWLPRKTDGSS